MYLLYKDDIDDIIGILGTADLISFSNVLFEDLNEDKKKKLINLIGVEKYNDLEMLNDIERSTP